MLKGFLRTVRRLLPRTARRQIYRAGTFFGDEFAPRTSQFSEGTGRSIRDALAQLRDWGFAPLTIVDVGAFRGDWTRLAKEIFPDARVLMIEAQDALRPFVEDVCSYYRDVSYAPALVGPDDGAPVEFVVTASGTGSSVLEEASTVARSRVTKQLSRLDTVAAQHGIDRIDLLKLDVQGYELEVLKGAERLLPTCELVLMEASLIPINRGCPLVADVLAFMQARGFRLLDVCSQVRRKDGALWQMDVLFVSERSRFVPSPELNADNW